jgi:hemerythrin
MRFGPHKLADQGAAHARESLMTAYFKWQPGYSVNIRQFDRQHKGMIALINELYEAMSTGEGQSVMEKVFSELLQYAETHFADEESIMRGHGFPGYMDHKRAHDELRQKVLDLQKRHREGGIAIALQVSTFLQNWLTEHILETDKLYVSFLNDRGVT